jgi:hypothetical protein
VCWIGRDPTVVSLLVSQSVTGQVQKVSMILLSVSPPKKGGRGISDPQSRCKHHSYMCLVCGKGVFWWKPRWGGGSTMRPPRPLRQPSPGRLRRVISYHHRPPPPTSFGTKWGRVRKTQAWTRSIVCRRLDFLNCRPLPSPDQQELAVYFFLPCDAEPKDARTPTSRGPAAVVVDCRPAAWTIHSFNHDH